MPISIGYGSSVAVGRMVGNVTTYTVLVGAKDITLPESVSDKVEVTSMDSPNRTKEYISGLNDSGEVSLDMNWIPGSPSDVLLSAIKTSGETVKVKFTIVGMANSEIYSGYLANYVRTAPVTEGMMATATFQISGLTT